MYHIVCPAKYWRTIINEEADKKLRKICLGIAVIYKKNIMRRGILDSGYYVGTVGEHGDGEVIQGYVKGERLISTKRYMKVKDAVDPVLRLFIDALKVPSGFRRSANCFFSRNE
jgi:hypothetical protein